MKTLKQLQSYKSKLANPVVDYVLAESPIYKNIIKFKSFHTNLTQNMHLVLLCSRQVDWKFRKKNFPCLL